MYFLFDGLNQDTTFATNLLVLANFSFLVVFVNFSVALLTETGNELFWLFFFFDDDIVEELVFFDTTLREEGGLCLILDMIQFG